MLHCSLNVRHLIRCLITDQHAGHRKLSESGKLYDKKRKAQNAERLAMVDRGESMSEETYETWKEAAPVKTKASDLQVGGDHYKSFSIQPSEFIFRNNLNWCVGNASRAPRGRVD